MAVVAERLGAGAVDARPLPLWPRSKAAVLVRSVLQALVLWPLVRLVCRPLRVEGARRLLRRPGPFVFVANHASHADTAVLLEALPRRIRRRTAPAAAEDYFFGGRVRGALTSLGIGAFPFPRRGAAGLARAERLLAAGWNVVLFPEGTRSRDGMMHRFKPGAGVLASRGATMVPVAVSGTHNVLPKGGRMLRRAPVAVVFGSPLRFERSLPAPAIADRLEQRVATLRAAASLLRPNPRRTWLDRARELARSRAGLWLAFGWGVAEALVWPIVPDVPVVLLAAAAPSRFLPLAAAAIGGSLAGGAIAYGLGAAGAGGWLIAHAPLVTPRMEAHASALLSRDGAAALLPQPWSGIPYKVFANQAPAAGIGFGPFLTFSLIGRGHRVVIAASIFAAACWPIHRYAKAWAGRLYGPFVLAFCVVFGMGLGRVVTAWS